MPRDHARIKTNRWNDPDWRSLTSGAQWLYDAVLTQQKLSYCGVIDYVPGRLADLATDLTEPKIKTFVKRLEQARFVVVDKGTSELLVRSYVRHDGVLDRFNMGKAMATALGAVTSMRIRDAVLTELARLMEDKPSAAGWEGFAEAAPKEFARAEALAGTVPLFRDA